MAVSKVRKKKVKKKSSGTKVFTSPKKVFNKIGKIITNRTISKGYTFKSDNVDMLNVDLDILIEKMDEIQEITLNTKERMGYNLPSIIVVKFFNVIKDNIILYKQDPSKAFSLSEITLNMLKKENLTNCNEYLMLVITLTSMFDEVNKKVLERRLVMHCLLNIQYYLFDAIYFENYDIKQLIINDGVKIIYDKNNYILNIDELKESEEVIRTKCIRPEFSDDLRRKIGEMLSNIDLKITGNQKIIDIISSHSDTYYIKSGFEYMNRDILIQSCKDEMEDDLKNKQRYVYGTEGVRIEVKKSEFIRSVDIYEDYNLFLALVRVKNSNNIYNSKVVRNVFDTVFEEEKVSQSDMIKGDMEIPVIFNKLDGKFNLDVSISSKVRMNFGRTKEQGNTYTRAVMMGALTAIYIAYYNHQYIKGVSIAPITNDTSSINSHTKKTHFRIAHIRKLPKGWNISEEARLKAKEMGLNIPKGYTFVEASNKKLEKKKIIKI